jgi:hypothetical protein
MEINRFGDELSTELFLNGCRVGLGWVGDGEMGEALGRLGHGDRPTGPCQGKGRRLAIWADSGERLGFGPWPRRIEKGFQIFLQTFYKIKLL